MSEIEKLRAVIQSARAIPEMSFTEFANLCMSKTNLTLNDLVDYRKERKK
jgi:hypothetical protein